MDSDISLSVLEKVGTLGGNPVVRKDSVARWSAVMTVSSVLSASVMQVIFKYVPAS